MDITKIKSDLLIVTEDASFCYEIVKSSVGKTDLQIDKAKDIQVVKVSKHRIIVSIQHTTKRLLVTFTIKEEAQERYGEVRGMMIKPQFM